MKIILCIFAIIILIVVHSLIAFYVDKFKVLKGDRISNFSLVPFSNMYLLGKYVFNILIGVILFIALFFVVNFTITLDDIKYGVTILNSNLRSVLFIVYFIVTIFTLVYASRKYNYLTRGKDRFKFVDLIYYLKETLWIVLLFVIIYAFLFFVVGYTKL